MEALTNADFLDTKVNMLIKDLPPLIAQWAIAEVIKGKGLNKLRTSEVVYLPLDIAFQFSTSQLGSDFWNTIMDMKHDALNDIIEGHKNNPGVHLSELIIIIGKLH